MKVYVDFVYQFRIGEALLEYTGECHPCSRMEENFGPGGITARAVEGGTISVGDAVALHITESKNE